MAQSTCVKCGDYRFEVTDPVTLPNALQPVVFVQCANCGGVVGVQDSLHAPHMILKLAQKLNIPAKDILAP